MTKPNADIYIVNNTSTDLRVFDDAIVAAIRAGGTLPDELADVISLTQVVVDGNTRWIINWV